MTAMLIKRHTFVLFATVLVAAAHPLRGEAPATDHAKAGPLPYPERRDIPEWWQRTRAFYCPWDNSGAGSSLMKYRTSRMGDFETFADLDTVLDDAERMGTNVLYLVGWWEPDYEHKSDYRPRAKWGGEAEFREGIEKVHRRGGRVLLYLEALIIHRDTELGRSKGPEWAMMDANGNYYPYYGRHQYYLMYPGPGSGWTDCIVGVAGRLAREYGIDGVHLDSYGVHLDHVLPDHNPAHPKGRDLEVFHRSAVELVRRMRAELRRYVPDAVVILEGAERTDLLDVCDGAQFESLPKLKNKPWYQNRRYPIYTSSFSIEEMEEILDAGYGLALSPWWFQDHLRGRDEKRLTGKTDKSSRFDQLQALHLCHNILYANGLVPERPADFDRLDQGIIAYLNKQGWGSEFDYPPLVQTVKRYLAVYGRHEDDLKRSPADAIREMLHEVAPLPASRPTR
jgi:hypothetical protein